MENPLASPERYEVFVYSIQHRYPHHKHIHPDIKHHRIPAPELRFNQPNLPFLIREIIGNLLQAE